MKGLTAKEFEDLFEQLLIDNSILYSREGEQVRRGGEAGKGQYDYTLRNCTVKAVELKSIGKLSNLRLPWPRTKNTPLHTHQLAALRKAGKPTEAGHLILHTETGTVYWMTMADLDRIICDSPGIIVSFAGDRLKGLEVDIGEFVKSLRGG